ncbi:TIGR02391 family protein [Stackebrandtia albiflava]|uniref:TIGR02391 family protein n=1 Tax=Stackebrandtia albiflava TaxID=406432 RepID=UPI001315037D|nr:TIGR02391 family protein [Stackebrandtia albiflava]
MLASNRIQWDAGILLTCTRADFVDQLETLAVGRKIASDLIEYRYKAERSANRPVVVVDGEPEVVSIDDDLLVLNDWITDYDRRITIGSLRAVTRSRFITAHFADSVEAGVKALNECVRAKSGSVEDGDALMTSVFSERNPKLRINSLRTQSEKSEQRGHMMMCQGVIAAWRNPRAHNSWVVDIPETALMMLETVQHLMQVTMLATRARRKRAT